MVGVEVLDHDETHPGLMGKAFEEPGERVESARGSADADDREPRSG
jgi:hypothetical protein